uniref:Topoisomerase-related nucleotidyltransferase, putative n=1 Tax=Theileria annulata TaxID=5874 RepID=A0A3B0MQ58_THEAN
MSDDESIVGSSDKQDEDSYPTSQSDTDIVDNDKLSQNYGAELYSMLDSEEQKQISLRNSTMRNKAKSLNKTKLQDLTKKELPGLYINISSQNDSEKLKSKPKDQKTLRNILDLYKLHSFLKTARLPFVVLLDIELNRLLQWLAPTEEEKLAKEQVLLQLEIVVNALFPHGKLKVFGSYVTGLSLPGADIDVCIQSEGDQLCILNMVVYALNRLGLVHSFECIYNTTVPVVKLVDKRTGVRLDLSVYNDSAFKTTKFIQEMCLKYKYMQPLILLIKLFLQSRSLGDTYFGGVGSYLLYCMVLSFLQLHNSTTNNTFDDKNSLATLYVDFFYYWGFVRDYKQFTTTVRGLGHVYPRALRKDKSDNTFSCENPLDNTVDIGANSFNMHTVISSFQNAFMVILLIIHLIYVLKSIESNVPNWFPSKEVSFEMNFSTILESIYDVGHPIFQYRKNKRCSNIRSEFFPENSKTMISSLESVINHLKKTFDGSKTNTFNPQRHLIESLSVGSDDVTIGEEMPFYIVAEAVGRDKTKLKS